MQPTQKNARLISRVGFPIGTADKSETII